MRDMGLDGVRKYGVLDVSRAVVSGLGAGMHITANCHLVNLPSLSPSSNRKDDMGLRKGKGRQCQSGLSEFLLVPKQSCHSDYVASVPPSTLIGAPSTMNLVNRKAVFMPVFMSSLSAHE